MLVIQELFEVDKVGPMSVMLAVLPSPSRYRICGGSDAATVDSVRLFDRLQHLLLLKKLLLR
jgi:hypothetical protein